MSEIATEITDTAESHSLAQTWKTESMQNINELNKQTALFWSLTINFATGADSKNSQYQLKQTRSNAIELAKLGGYKQCPNNKSYLKECITAEEYERMGTLLASMIEFLITLLHKNLTLKENPRLRKVKINSGFTSNKSERRKILNSSVAVSSDSSSVNQEAEVPFLLRHIKELQQLVDKIYESSDFKPWAMEPHTFMQLLADKANHAEEGGTLVGVTNAKFSGSRKCKLLLLCGLVGLVVISLLSVTLVLLT